MFQFPFGRRDGGSVAQQEDHQEEGEEVQEAAERSQDLREGKVFIFIFGLIY